MGEVVLFPQVVRLAEQKDSAALKQYFHEQRASTARQALNLLGVEVIAKRMAQEALIGVRDQGARIRAVVLYNVLVIEPKRKEFLLAHMLGHFLLHVVPHLRTGKWQTSGLREIRSPLHRYLNHENDHSLELEADAFAATFCEITRIEIGQKRNTEKTPPQDQSI